MGYTLSEMVVGEPLTPERKEWLKRALKFYRVSEAGAEQFVGSLPLSAAQDRQQLLDLVNRVIVKASHAPRFRGKGPR